MRILTKEEIKNLDEISADRFVEDMLFSIHKAIDTTIAKNYSINKAKNFMKPRFSVKNEISPTTMDNILKLTEAKHNIYLLEQCIKHDVRKVMMEYYESFPPCSLSEEEIEAQHEKK